MTSVIWFKYQNNLKTIIDINDKGRFNGGTVAYPSLIIYSVLVEDSGNYTCQAINDVGETLSVPVHLGVYDGKIYNYFDTIYKVRHDTPRNYGYYNRQH